MISSVEILANIKRLVFLDRHPGLKVIKWNKKNEKDFKYSISISRDLFKICVMELASQNLFKNKKSIFYLSIYLSIYLTSIYE